MILFMCLRGGNSLKNNSFSEDPSANHIDHLATETNCASVTPGVNNCIELASVLFFKYCSVRKNKEVLKNS